jgi:hypothetical protein
VHEGSAEIISEQAEISQKSVSWLYFGVLALCVWFSVVAAPRFDA